MEEKTNEQMLDEIVSRKYAIRHILAKKSYLTDKSCDSEDMSVYNDWQRERRELRVEYGELEKQEEILLELIKQETLDAMEKLESQEADKPLESNN